MRVFIFSTFLLAFLPIIILNPYVGVLFYSWISFMSPHRLVWGFPSAIPLAMITAVLTLFAWVVSKEPKRVPFNATVWLIVAFMADISLTTSLALNPAAAFDFWKQVTKELLFVLVTIALTRSRSGIMG